LVLAFSQLFSGCVGVFEKEVKITPQLTACLKKYNLKIECDPSDETLFSCVERNHRLGKKEKSEESDEVDFFVEKPPKIYSGDIAKMIAKSLPWYDLEDQFQNFDELGFSMEILEVPEGFANSVAAIDLGEFALEKSGGVVATILVSTALAPISAAGKVGGSFWEYSQQQQVAKSFDLPEPTHGPFSKIAREIREKFQQLAGVFDNGDRSSKNVIATKDGQRYFLVQKLSIWNAACKKGEQKIVCDSRKRLQNFQVFDYNRSDENQ